MFTGPGRAALIRSAHDCEIRLQVQNRHFLLTNRWPKIRHILPPGSSDCTHCSDVMFSVRTDFFVQTFKRILRYQRLLSIMSNPKIEGEGISANITLNDGIKMPLFGLGLYNVEEGGIEEAVSFALQNGYRLLDTAKAYG